VNFWKQFSILPLVLLATLPAAAQKLETVADFSGAMVTGVTVSQTGRIFVCYPHWGDAVPFTVAEIKDGRAVAYPNVFVNRLNLHHPGECLYSVQSVVVDPKNRLWALDTGSVKLGSNVPNGPKLVCMNLTTNKITRKIFFPRSVVTPETYLNDVRFDLRRGTAGTAYITDSGAKSPNGIIVVDLATGSSTRRLGGHPSVKAEPGFIPIVEGRPLLGRNPGQTPQPLKLGSDGIAISVDGKTLYYCPLIGRHLYGVSTDALADKTKSEAEVEATVHDFGIKGASDGMETDTSGLICVTDYEHARVLRGPPGGPYTTIAQAASRYWLDTLSVANDGYLYFTANELQRQANFHNGKDLRVKPYKLYRVKINGASVLLK
jgi:sugar lactone lactonase YvrE